MPSPEQLAREEFDRLPTAPVFAMPMTEPPSNKQSRLKTWIMYSTCSDSSLLAATKDQI
jgi:hypothetical protein